MNFFASPHRLVRGTLVALWVACGFTFEAVAQMQPSFGQPQSVQGPAGNPYGSGINTNPYVNGQQLVPGARSNRHKLRGRPAGPAAQVPTTHRHAKRRRKHAAPFNSTTPAAGAAAAGTAATATAGVAAPVPQELIRR